MWSKIVLGFTTLFLCVTAFFYYPKWEKSGSEATISWDVSGYYLYLPATFIYKDLKQLDFYPSILEQYAPTPDFQQAFPHEASGSYVLKYSAGQAIAYLPFFLVAHAYASNSDQYQADGYSFPYQLAIGIGSLVIAFVGLFFLRKILKVYFRDEIVAITLFLIAIGTNYLEYSAITGAMTHNYLFTLYTLLIWGSIRIYRRPTYWKAAGIGICIGLAALTRPTEIIAVLIPLLWGITSIQKRFTFLKQHWLKLLVAAFICGLIGSIQLFYWKYVTGEWLVYSYEEQGFSWFNPHILDCTIRFRAGWLIYTPMMIFSLLGFYWLYLKERSIFWATLLFSLLFMYIAFAWDIWWYGGSLGQRAMIQCYPILAFPFAAFWEWVLKKQWRSWIISGITIFFLSYNLWLHHQAHLGGLLKAGFMTEAYFWEIFMKFDVPIEARKYLDTNEKLRSEPQGMQTVRTVAFDKDEIDATFLSDQFKQSEPFALRLDQTRQESPAVVLQQEDLPADATWLRAEAAFFTPSKEWDTWRMTNFTVRFLNGKQVVKQKLIRIQRILSQNQWKRIWVDVELSEKPFTHIEVTFWNAESTKAIFIDDLEIKVFH